MSRLPTLSLVLAAGLIAGCGGNNGALSTSNPGKPTPHGGSVVSLPGGKGYVEIVKKADVPKEGNVIGELQFFFLKDDFSTEEKAPTSGSLKVTKGQNITLLVKEGGLSTPSGPALFAGKDPDGTLTAEIDGKTVIVPLGLR